MPESVLDFILADYTERVDIPQVKIFPGRFLEVMTSVLNSHVVNIRGEVPIPERDTRRQGKLAKLATQVSTL